MESHRSRGWIMVINNYDRRDETMFAAVATAEAKYAVCGFELGEKKTPHMQTYLYFENQRKFSFLKSLFPRSHLEVAKGSPQQNREYCIKDGNYWEHGSVPQSGRITWDRLEQVMQNPKEDIHLYKQYKSVYNELKEKKEHTRRIEIVKRTFLYEHLKEFKSVCFDDEDVYQGEECFVVTLSAREAFIDRWLNGYPTKIRRGYEVVLVDPEVMILLYDTEKERVELEKKYIGYYYDTIP